MQVSRSVAGVRSLKGVTAATSSALMLDLHALAAEAPNDPEYLERPMFMHPLLNRTIIVKHNSEEDRLAPRRFNATKVIFPLDPSDLNLGGQYLFVEQRDFVGALTRHLDYRNLPLDRDVAVLRALDKLPTLDPFLVREILSQQRIEVGRCYCRLSKSDRTDMLDFVAHEIEALIKLCFGEAGQNEERSRRLSQLLLADQANPELEPLRATLRMEPGEFFEATFAWKAFLYYRWRSHALTPQLRSTLSSLSQIRQRQFERDEYAFVMGAKRLLERTITVALHEVGRRLKAYDRAFGSLTNKENPDGFQEFLLYGSGLFLNLGEQIGRLEQIVGFWRNRFGQDRITDLSPDDVMDGMRDLLQGLSVRTAGAQPVGDRSGEALTPCVEPIDEELADLSVTPVVT